MLEIRKRYISAFPNEKDFISYMSTWVQLPKKETSLMHDAIAKYKIMPELIFDKETLKQISQYIFETEFKLPTSN